MVNTSVSLPSQPDSLKFAIIGDSGTGSSSQYKVAEKLIGARATFPYEFVLMMGDNLYSGSGPKDYKKKFEEQRHELEVRNDQLKAEAATRSAKLDGQSYIIIRQAGETGQLYGSVSARDVAETIGAASKYSVHRNHIALDQPINIHLTGVPQFLCPALCRRYRSARG